MIRADDDRVVLIAPPGEAAILELRGPRGVDRATHAIEILRAARAAALPPGDVVWLRHPTPDPGGAA